MTLVVNKLHLTRLKIALHGQDTTSEGSKSSTHYLMFVSLGSE